MFTKERDYHDLPTAKIVSYHFSDDMSNYLDNRRGSLSGNQLNSIIDIIYLSELEEEEEEEVMEKIRKDKKYLKLESDSNAIRPKNPNVYTVVQGKEYCNLKLTDEDGKQTFSYDTAEDVKISEEKYFTALNNWTKNKNAPKEYINGVMKMEKEKKRKKLEKLFKIKYGDIIENSNEFNQHYQERWSGWYITSGRKDGRGGELREPDPGDGDEISDDIFPYGFSLGPSFPVGYWSNAKSKSGLSWKSLCDWILEPIDINILINELKKNKHDVLEKDSDTTVFYFDWGALQFPYPKNDVVKKIKIMHTEYNRLYFESIGRGISRLVVDRYDAFTEENRDVIDL